MFYILLMNIFFCISLSTASRYLFECICVYVFGCIVLFDVQSHKCSYTLLTAAIAAFEHYISIPHPLFLFQSSTKWKSNQKNCAFEKKNNISLWASSMLYGFTRLFLIKCQPTAECSNENWFHDDSTKQNWFISQQDFVVICSICIFSYFNPTEIPFYLIKWFDTMFQFTFIWKNQCYKHLSAFQELQQLQTRNRSISPATLCSSSIEIRFNKDQRKLNHCEYITFARRMCIDSAITLAVAVAICH